MWRRATTTVERLGGRVTPCYNNNRDTAEDSKHFLSTYHGVLSIYLSRKHMPAKALVRATLHQYFYALRAVFKQILPLTNQ